MDDVTYEEKYGTSPAFRKSNDSPLVAGTFLVHNFEISEPAAQKYLPLNYIVVTNNDTASDLQLIIDGDLDYVFLIPPGTIKGFDSDTIPAFRSYQLKNIGSSDIAAGKIEVIAQRVAIKTEEIVRGAHRAILTKKRRA